MPNKPSYCSRSILFFISLLLSLLIKAQSNGTILQTPIKFSNAELTLKNALDEMNETTNVKIVYGSNKNIRKYVVIFSAKKLLLTEAIEQIQSQTPVNVVYKDDYIIVKPRELSDRYLLQGKVHSAKTGEALVGVNVVLKDNFRGTATNFNGDFSMSLPPGQYNLMFSYIGFKTQTLNINLFEDIELDVQLEESAQEIAEINIFGKKNEFEDLETGRNIEYVESKTLENLPTNDVNDALHGRLNGVWVTKTSGAPGDHNKVHIRGISSILGSTDPLYVVDGMIVPVVNFQSLGISDLNAHDVENITVLKDAASTALYGYLGGNGVILVNTKKGGGPTEFNFGYKRGFQYFNKRYNTLHTEDFLNTLELSDEHFSSDFYLVNEQKGIYPEYPRYTDSLGNTMGYTNFQDVLFRNGAVDEYQLSANGNIQSIDYYFSANYFKHSGIIQNSDYDKYTFTGNVSKKFKDRASIRLLFKGSHQDNTNNLDNYLGNKTIFKGINYEPAYYTTPDSFLRKNNRLYFNDDNSQSLVYLANHMYTPEMLIYQEEKKKTANNYSVTSHVFFKITNDLAIRANHSLAIRDLHYQSYIPDASEGQSVKYLSSQEKFGIFSQQYDLTFNKKLGFHSLNAFVRYRNYQDNIKWDIDSVAGIDITSISYDNDLYLRGSQSVFGEFGSVSRSINSAIAGCASYSYKDKYFLSALISYDHLKEGYYVDNDEIFPSVAIDWDIAKEQFLPFPAWVDAFHLSVNWGQAGNYPLNSLSNDLYSESQRYAANNQSVTAATITSLANHYIQHEKVTEINYGSNISLWKERVQLAGNYYIKKHTDLLLQRTAPYYYGGGTFYQNAGEMETKGYEIGLKIIPFNRTDFYWHMKFGYSSHDQRITKLYEGEAISFNNVDVLYPDFYAVEGESLGDITGYQYAGKWDNAVHSPLASPNQRYISLGGAAYAKTDSSRLSKLLEGDKTIIGNSMPNFSCNWINTLGYKNFELETLWYAVMGVDKYNATKASTYISGVNTDVKEIIEDERNYIMSEAFYNSSFFVEDASFLRLKTLRLTYYQPHQLFSRIHLAYSLILENMITLTNYTGYDPEATIYTNNNISDNAMDRGAYPSPKSIYLNVRMKF